ncbi:30S ribosomal protein S12 methylthiotransferase accessory factor YcaO [Pseudomonas sp. F1_0610]|uniref:30S ribosomal protein S12 methylthiotransferase accessory factor YcaO n=1 Tax=Pseudomonas sp. F1_0610 TaxID=3114284 RepID=UPI0039C04E2D
MQTFIPGKDAALEDSIARFQSQLSALGFTIEEASWLNPVPNVWSVHIRDTQCSLCFTNGKGATKKAALASALGEYLERLSCNYFFADYYLGKKIAEGDFVHYPQEKWFAIPADDSLPEGILDEALREFYDPENELTASNLVDIQSNNAQRGICALPFVRQSDQQVIYIPMNIIGNLYVSNGMSAGNNPTEAHVQAMSEIFERSVKNRILCEGISLPEIPEAVLARYPQVQESIAALENQGFPIFAYDASLGGEFPVICVVLFNPNNGSCFASFGAHPDFGVALERSVTELLQGRSLKQLDVFPEPTFDNEQVADYTNLETHFTDSSGLVSWDLFKEEADYPFVDWSFKGSTQEEFANLMAIFSANNAEVYIADYNHLGVDACRILVPSLSEIYLTEDLTLANNNMGQHLRETLLNLPTTAWDEEQYLALIEQLDAEGFDDAVLIGELLGLAFGSDNAWSSLRIGELKSMLALAGGDLDTALSWAEWAQAFNESVFSAQRHNYYRCLIQLLNLALDEERDYQQYLPAFARMYGEDVLETALDHIEGEQRFHGLFAIHEDFSNLPMHAALLAAYEKLQLAKSNAI